MYVYHLPWDQDQHQDALWKVPSHNLQDLKNMLLTFWCKILQDTLRGLVESML